MKCLLSIALLVAVGPALADAYRTPKLKVGAPVSIQAYGRQNPACLEWTDGCVLCTSNAGVAACSTPGIACIPAGLTCKRRATSPATP